MKLNMWKKSKISQAGKAMLFVLMVMLLLPACNDMLEVDSNRLTTDTEFDLNAPTDSVYAFVGLFSKLQKLADSYVLLGELRGDLLTASSAAGEELNQIENFEVTTGNKYTDVRKYYDVINNCNYLIQKFDTNKVDRGQKLVLRQYAAVKTIRAWTYMQLALNYKTVKYLEKPILTIADAEKDYSSYEIGLQELTDKLINDLEPLKDQMMPSLGALNGYGLIYSLFLTRFVLGDLYLWRGALTGSAADYENAARNYYKLIYDYSLTLNGQMDKATHIPLTTSSISYWIPVNNTISSTANLFWIKSMRMGNGEVYSAISCPDDNGEQFMLDTLNNQRFIVPTVKAISNWDNQTYFLNEASTANGDLRKYGSISYNDHTNSYSTSFISDFTFTGNPSAKYVIYKYKINPGYVPIYRASLLYLRYAEALNRLNKPKIAFAVLKYGLNGKNMIVENIAPASEKGTPVLDYINFNNVMFDNNVGIRMRGLGNVDKDTAFFKIPRLNSMADSVLYVEDKIEEELAQETAFECNRFHDLMRFAYRRMRNGEADASYLANKIAKKHGYENTLLKSKLLNTENWYIRKQ